MVKDNSISLRLEGDKITSDKFYDSIYNFYGFINEVASEIFGIKNPIKWIVSVGKGSIDLLNKPELKKSLDIKKQDKFFNEIKIGIPILEKETKHPSSFNDRALEHLKKLALLPDSQNGVKKVNIIINDEKYILTQHTAANVDAVLTKYPVSLGSIEGKLSTLSERGGIKVYVYNAITDRPVICHSDKEDFLKEALTAFGKRVYVYGIVHYNTSGKAKSITVKKLRILEDESELPDILKSHGILENME